MGNKLIYFWPKRILIFAVFAVCLVSLPFFSSRLNQISSKADQEPLLFIPPENYLANLSGGFKYILSDAYYIQGILTLSDKFDTRLARLSWVQEHFKAAVLIDPEMLQAYFFGGIVLARNQETGQKAIEFLKRGLEISPGKWEIPYWIGFNYYQLGEYLEAVKFYKKASGLPGAPNYLRSNQPMFYYKAGESEQGVFYLEGLKETIKDSRQLKWVELKIEWLKNIVSLERGVEGFKERYGRAPKSLKILVDKGLIDMIPDDPFGRGYYLDKESGRVKSRFGRAKNTTQPKPEPKSRECPSCKN
jgi:tetratricopeptide (TPR) repeat protein